MYWKVTFNIFPKKFTSQRGHTNIFIIFGALFHSTQNKQFIVLFNHFWKIENSFSYQRPLTGWPHPSVRVARRWGLRWRDSDQQDLLDIAHTSVAQVEAIGHWSDLAGDDGDSAEHDRRVPDDLWLHWWYKGLWHTQQLLTNLTKPLIEPPTLYNASSDESSGTAEQNSSASHGPVATAW